MPMKIVSVFSFFLVFAIEPAVATSTPAQYAGEETREIKSLSQSEIADLLSGRGMGLARAAALNGYPGPMHVLELASQLKLSGSQEAKTREVFSRMQASAKDLGAQLVDAERSLDLLFKTKQVDQSSLARTLEKIATLQSRVRGVHLRAHMEQAALLTSEQISQYAKLRGYTGGASGPREGHGHKH